MREFFDAFNNQVSTHPDRTAIRTVDGPSLSYAALAVCVDHIAASIPVGAKSVAIVGMPSAAWIAADLAATLMGCRTVPVPFFFSPDQQAHILRDAGVAFIVACDMPGGGAETGIPTLMLDSATLAQDADNRAGSYLVYTGGAERVIYTSGTTGAPKGVRHGDRQLDYAIRALGDAAEGQSDDRHISLLPPSLLLEQIAGQLLPLSLGAEVILAPDACLAALSGNIAPTASALSVTEPTTTVLVPQQLSGLVHFAEATGWRPPASLRLVAVGGAPMAPDILVKARALGLPVRFGYGLSECCSVVSVMRAGDGVGPGGADMVSTGTPLSGTKVQIIDGEIVVSGPGVMIGYLGSEPLSQSVWHTGDLGRIEADGTLSVLGRKDRQFSLSTGRNLSPEWIESISMALPWVKQARVTGSGEVFASLNLHIHQQGEAGLQSLPDGNLTRMIADVFKGLPAYAIPGCVTLEASDWTRTVNLNPASPNSPATQERC